MGLMVSIQTSELGSEQKCGLVSLMPYGTRAHSLFGVPPITPNIVAPFFVLAGSPWLRAWAKPSVSFLKLDELLPSLVKLIPAYAVRKVPRPVERRPAVHLQRRRGPPLARQPGAVNGKWGVLAMNRISDMKWADDVTTLATNVASATPHIVAPLYSFEGRDISHDRTNRRRIR